MTIDAAAAGARQIRSYQDSRCGRRYNGDRGPVATMAKQLVQAVTPGDRFKAVLPHASRRRTSPSGEIYITIRAGLKSSRGNWLSQVLRYRTRHLQNPADQRLDGRYYLNGDGSICASRQFGRIALRYRRRKKGESGAYGPFGCAPTPSNDSSWEFMPLFSAGGFNDYARDARLQSLACQKEGASVDSDDLAAMPLASAFASLNGRARNSCPCSARSRLSRTRSSAFKGFADDLPARFYMLHLKENRSGELYTASEGFGSVGDREKAIRHRRQSATEWYGIVSVHWRRRAGRAD